MSAASKPTTDPAYNIFRLDRQPLSDRFQCRGLGTQLLQQLLQVGRDERLDRICAEILSDNGAMQRVCEKLGFQIYRTQDASVVRAEIVM